MKTKQIFSLMLTVFVLASSMVVAQTKKTGNEKVVFDVNMHCGSCQQKIEKNIAFEKGVKAMEVSLENKTVALTYDASKTDADKLQAALVKLGYKASVKADKACAGEVAKAGCKDNALADSKQAGCKDKAATAGCKDSGCKDKAATAGCKDSGCKDKAATEGCKDKAAEGCKTEQKCADKTKTAEAVKTEGCTTKKAA